MARRCFPVAEIGSSSLSGVDKTAFLMGRRGYFLPIIFRFLPDRVPKHLTLLFHVYFQLI